METELNQLRALLKDVISWQNLFYQYKEEERKKTKEIQKEFHLKKVVAQYPYIKGGEWKSFLALHLVVTILLGVAFFAFFDYQVSSLLISIALMLGTNFAFIFAYKPYKVEEWYLIGAVFYGVLIGVLSGITLALASIAFFIEGRSTMLEASALWLTVSIITYAVGGVFPFTYELLTKQGLKHPELLKKLTVIENEKREAIGSLKATLHDINHKLEAATQRVESYDIVPSQFKTQRALEFTIFYLDTGKVTTIEEALTRFDFEVKDALRTMRILKLS